MIKRLLSRAGVEVVRRNDVSIPRTHIIGFTLYLGAVLALYLAVRDAPGCSPGVSLQVMLGQFCAWGKLVFYTMATAGMAAIAIAIKYEIYAVDNELDVDPHRRSSDLYSYASTAERSAIQERYESKYGSAKDIFSGWQIVQVVEPKSNQENDTWRRRQQELGFLIKTGVIVILVGRCRSGKTYLLERIPKLTIIDNFRTPDGYQTNACIPDELLEGELVAIDETHAHSKQDVEKLLGEKSRGCALVFQQVDMFRNYDIAEALADRHVLFIEFVVPEGAGRYKRPTGLHGTSHTTELTAW